MMFSYSFLAMTAYNVIKPLTRSKFITDLGADNLPYVLLAAGFIIGILMTGYAWLMARLPQRWALPITQVGMAGMLLLFWFLFHSSGAWVSIAFYLSGLILGVLLISQFWTLANLVYDPRQAKRLFGFIGGGAPLGGIAGSALASYAKEIGSTNLLLPSALLMAHLRRARHAHHRPGKAGRRRRDRPEVRKRRRRGRSVRAAAAIEAPADHRARDQLRGGRRGDHRAAAEHGRGGRKGASSTDSITAFLAQVGLWTSSIGFVIQVWLTSKIHRYLGIGFALMILPVSLGSTGDHHAVERGAVGAGDRARPRSVAALHRRQDDPRDPVPAAAERHQAEGQVVRRRHGRSRRESRRRAAAAGAREAVGAAPRLAAPELREPGGHGAVDRHGAPRAARLPDGVPLQHRAPRPRRRRKCG